MTAQLTILIALGTATGFIMMLTAIPKWRWWLLNAIWLWDVTFFITASYVFYGTMTGMVIAMMTSLAFSIMLRVMRRVSYREKPKIVLSGYKPSIKWNNTKEIKL